MVISVEPARIRKGLFTKTLFRLARNSTFSSLPKFFSSTPRKVITYRTAPAAPAIRAYLRYPGIPPPMAWTTRGVIAPAIRVPARARDILQAVTEERSSASSVIDTVRAL